MKIAVLEAANVLSSAQALDGLAGVHAVTGDPVRRQLVVRYDSRTVGRRQLARVSRGHNLARSSLWDALSWWPRIAEMLMIVSA